jgi:hypothetical protein
MTLREFELFCLGKSDEAERVLDVAAVHASWIMNVWTKRKVKPTDLFKKKGDEESGDFVAEIKKIRGLDEKDNEGKPMTPEEQADAFDREMRERVKKQKRREYWASKGVIDE